MDLFSGGFSRGLSGNCSRRLAMNVSPWLCLAAMFRCNCVSCLWLLLFVGLPYISFPQQLKRKQQQTKQNTKQINNTQTRNSPQQPPAHPKKPPNNPQQPQKDSLATVAAD